MTCRELVEDLLDYRSGDLDAVRARTIDRHLMACDRCVRWLCDYELTVRLVRSASV